MSKAFPAIWAGTRSDAELYKVELWVSLLKKIQKSYSENKKKEYILMKAEEEHSGIEAKCFQVNVTEIEKDENIKCIKGQLCSFTLF